MTSDEGKARQRYLVISAARLAGAIFMAIGLGIIANGFMDLPVEAGYMLFAMGVIEFIVVPVLLARMWKTPEE
ncbi:hypothetical protein ACFOWX_00205 [Sphingorhabdus arenilitoris]|uniref:Uncharacterized protein n=1 Tax=Sphingorhabdus arenilitoris TaxID=1490041 RepID=A0ABV8RBQ6_9SPHN